MAAAQRSKRKNFLINPKFQLRIIGYHLLVAGCIILGLFLAHRWFFGEIYRQGVDLNLPKDHPYFSMLIREQAVMNNIFLIVSLGTLAFIFSFGVLISHKIAGPIYRISKELHLLSQGDFNGPVKLRKGDFFPELADAFNECAGSIHSRKSNRKSA